MDPIEKLNAMTSKKTSNIILKGEPLKGISSSSQENFFRKSQKNFSLSKSDSYGTIIQIMKTDIFQIQEMINQLSYISKMFKLSSRNMFTSKKISEIEENGDVKTLIDKINEDSSTPEKLGRIYSCSNANELISKMGIELGLYEAFIKKLNELFFILNLKYNGEENSIKLSQESFSKFLVVKLALEKIMQKSQNTYINDTDNSLNNSQNNFNKNEDNNLNLKTNSSSQNNILEIEKNKKIEEYEKIKLTNNINDILLLDSNLEKEASVEPMIKHLCRILRDFFGKLGMGYADLLNKYSNRNTININNNFSNVSVENLFSQKLLLERLLMEKEKIINSGSTYNLTGANVVKEATNDNQIEELINKHNNEKKKIEAEMELAKIQNEKYLKEIKMLNDKYKEKLDKYEEEIRMLKKYEIKEKDSSSLYNIDESKFFILFLK